MDIVQIFGDYIHLLGVIILLVKIWLTKNCAGISGKTQVLYALVFTARSTDLTIKHTWLYSAILKIVFISINYITVLLVFIFFRKTYDRQHDIFRIELLILPCAVFSLFMNDHFETVEVLQTFSIYLEALAIIPQVYLVSKTKQIESIVVSYVACLGLYRGCYLMHYLYAYYKQDSFERIAIASALVQLIFYCDFFGRNLPILKPKNVTTSRGTAANHRATSSQRRNRNKNNAMSASVMVVKVDDTNRVDVERPEPMDTQEKVILLTSKEEGVSN